MRTNGRGVCMNDSKVSIVVAVYNGEQYIDKCIGGLQAQTYKNVEFLIVDDGSTDRSGELLDQYAEKDERIKVIHQKNGGLSAARNAGTRAATGDYVVYFDVDDTVTNSVIEDNVKLANKHDADVVMFCFWYYLVDRDVKQDNNMSEGFVGNGEEYFDKFLIPTIDNEVFNAPWNKMYSLSFLRENKLQFNPEFPIYEDIIFASKMLQYADSVVVNNKSYYTYYVKSSGSLITKYTDGYFASVTRFYDNAMKYCSMHKNNSRQIEKFNTLYLKLVMTNLKQISCHKAFSQKHRCELIKDICNSEQVRKAVDLAKLDRRRSLTKNLIRFKSVKALCTMYQILNYVQKSNMQ